MGKYINLDDCLSFLENKCYYFLDSVSKMESEKDDIIIFSKNDYHIIVKEYELKDNDDIGGEKSFDIGQVNRIHIKDNDKVKFAIILEKYFNENESIENIKVKYKNLFNESKSIVISKEYSNGTVRYLEESFNNIDKKIESSASKIFNFCEFFKEKDDWIQEIEAEDRLEQIPLLSVDDIEYFHSKGIKTIEKFEDENIFKKIYEDMPEGLKDKYDDIQEWLKNKDENIPACNHKYYLNWIKFNQSNTEDEKSNKILEVNYAVNFEGHSATDIVYAFSYQQMYLEDAKKENIILENSEKSKDVVLKHYAKIVNKIYDVLKNKSQGKDIVFVALAPYARKNFEKVIETILEYKSVFDQDIINQTLNVSEYFGFDYYLEKEAITYANPYVDPWIDLKNVIEKYICTGISTINSFTEVYSKLCNMKLNSLNSHDYSWALKPGYINDTWIAKNEEKYKHQENVSKQLDIKLSNIYNLYSAVYSKKSGLLSNIMIYPNKRNFTNNGCFMSRFMLKETISSIKEYKQGLADYSFDRLIKKGLILELTNVEFKKEDSYEENGYKKKIYCYTFKYDEKVDFDNNAMIEYFNKKEDFEKVLKRSFDFSNLIDLDFNEKLLITKGKKLSMEDNRLYVIESIFDTVEDMDKNYTTIIINNTEKVLRNLEENNTVKIDKNMKYDEDFYFESELEGKQKEVYQRIIANKFTLLLGPPGTGKTYTIAKVVNELSKKYTDKKFFITGFTNLSIENCIFKIINEGKEKQKVGKWKVVKDKKYFGKIDIINSANQLKNIDVLGTTIYQFNKFTDQKFDYIIVDEASQMKVPEFLMTNQVAKEDTHFLIVGDDNQLPPIIKNKYLNFDKKEILVAKSIFSYISTENPDCIIRLNDCYRMNRVLCEYPGKKIYQGFKPAKQEIETQRLELSEEYMNYGGNKKYLSKILNPDYPIVLCLVDNKGVKRNFSEIEALLCAQISRELYDNLQNRHNGKNTVFWKKNLAIVSPHHTHIRRIKNELSKIFNDEEEKEFFVDTVDKMQGQEADAIIVSYGVTDSQIAFKEKEFIYNRNRLNVSITRARSKLIIILSKELLDIDRRLMDDMELKYHIDFMREYVEYLKGNSENEKEKNRILEGDDFILYGISFN